ncbi:hypothetical protein OIE43_42540 [Streptomyces pseudovenezuelae]|uniref:hypothetical protein n=1 Tax=Streptomyces pseudovenezuelae TaxID=67350 RepID=UPI002E345C17|nr:hypothetical protein [Streptomyces pseudovenezuelae]
MLQGILYVLHTGIGWEDLLQRILLAQLNAANEINWSWAVIDGSHTTRKRGSQTLSPFQLPLTGEQLG